GITSSFCYYQICNVFIINCSRGRCLGYCDLLIIYIRNTNSCSKSLLRFRYLVTENSNGNIYSCLASWYCYCLTRDGSIVTTGNCCTICCTEKQFNSFLCSPAHCNGEVGCLRGIRFSNSKAG